MVVDIKKGHKVIDEFLHAFAGEILDNGNYRLAEVGSSFSINKDSAAVWQAEWGDAYKDKQQMRYLVYALEYSINYVMCDTCGCN